MDTFILFLVLLFSGSFRVISVQSTPTRSSTPPTARPTAKNDHGDPRHSFPDDQRLPQIDQKTVDDLGLVEVKETELPEDSEIYVLEEFEGGKTKKADDEIMETANNIVFRPLFRYRSKQQALRRNQLGRRRYFVPKRYYRRAYYPYYYRHRIYYY